MKAILRLIFMGCFFQTYAQVGINTTTPNAQLEVKASNAVTPSNTDGLLIPRVDAFPITNPTAAQQGMMVYLTIASGANAPGFYYWDNLTTTWVGLTSTANGDKDWYKVGTTNAPTAITDDMFHSGKVGIGNSNPSSKLHVMNSSSGMTTNPSSVVTFESSASNYFSILSGTDSAVLFGANGVSTDGGVIYNPSWSPGSMVLRTNGNVDRMVIGPTGNIGLGSLIPQFPLHFQSIVGDKISLFGGTGAHYGFGIQGSLFQMHSAGITDDIAFGYGSSATFTERMRIKGNGNVGIGLTNPPSKLHVMTTSSGMTPNPLSVVTFESSTSNYFSILSGTDSAVLFGSNGVATDGGIIYNPGWLPRSMLLRTNGNVDRMVIGSDGNIAFGSFVPQFPLHFPQVFGDKISLYGGTGNHVGFGVQGNLLQIHSDFVTTDVAFGYGSSTSFNETMRVKGNGNVGIGIATPDYPLQFKTVLGDKISLFGGTGNHVGFGVQGNLLQIHSDYVFTDVAFGYGSSAAFTENMRIKGNGNVGIGIATPDYPLQFKSAVGDKISLFGGTGAHYGLGIQAALLQMYSAGITDDIAFGYGTSAAFTEAVRIKGTGEVGIGTSTPTTKLEVNGYTKLGSNAPGVKMIKLTGTTGAAQGNTTFITHGVTNSKILSISILVEYAAGACVPPSYNGSAGFEYDYYLSGVSIAVWTKSGNSTSILSKPIRVLVTYEE